MTDTVRLRDVTVVYGDRLALEAVTIDLPVAPGLVVVTGPRGAGKSTLLGVACGYLPPTSGTVDTVPRHQVAVIVGGLWSGPPSLARFHVDTPAPPDARLLVADDLTYAMPGRVADRYRHRLTVLAREHTVLVATHDPLIDQADAVLAVHAGHVRWAWPVQGSPTP